MEAKTHKMKMVYTIAESGNGKSYWTKIGVGFVNNDGSINLKLDALPVNGQIQVREYEPYDPARSGNGQQRPRTLRDPSRERESLAPLVEQQAFGGL